ncbi:MAG: gamma-glutamyltransferase family protein [Caldilineaceae bacterium]|nr:gamma-glutamyltransferase family protein [Caldilineaceae bacterium]
MANAIVAPQPIAVEEGAKVLMAGGNAIDAAVTAAFVQAIVDPHSCGIGGYMLVNLHLAGDQRPVGIDAPALAGSKTSPTMWEDKLLRPNPDGWGYFLEGKVNDAGYTSICIPGWIKGMAAILERYGTISWADAIAPAIRVATEGWVVSEFRANTWKRKAAYPEATSLRDYITMHAEASRIYLKPDGDTYDKGEIICNPDYAATLQHLAAHGPEDFYTGDLAARMASDLAANGSNVTTEDLAEYTIREDRIVTGTYRDYTITSAASPHGGPTLIAILNILEGFDLPAMGHNTPDYIYTVGMAMKAAFADRNPYMADPLFSEVPEQWMMSKERAAHWRDRIKAGEQIEVSFTPTGTPDTTQVTVVDNQGNCISLTHSLGSSSGVITPGMGFMYNNSMVNFYPISGHPNSIAPRKSRTTGMAPTIVYKGDKPVLVLGAPGATRIITSILQVITNVLDFGMNATEATHAPRIDCQVGAIRAHMRIPEYVLAEVRRRHPIVHIPQSHGGFALVHAITIDPVTGKLAGGADSGADGMALVV